MNLSTNRALLLVLAASAALASVQSLDKRMDAVSPKSRTIEVSNQSGKRLVVEWVNPDTGDMVTMDNDFVNGAKTRFDSYVNHTFAIHENADSCRVGKGGECEVRFITVNENSEQGKFKTWQRFRSIIATRNTSQ